MNKTLFILLGIVAFALAGGLKNTKHRNGLKTMVNKIKTQYDSQIDNLKVWLNKENKRRAETAAQAKKRVDDAVRAVSQQKTENAKTLKLDTDSYNKFVSAMKSEKQIFALLKGKNSQLSNSHAKRSSAILVQIKLMESALEKKHEEEKELLEKKNEERKKALKARERAKLRAEFARRRVLAHNRRSSKKDQARYTREVKHLNEEKALCDKILELIETGKVSQPQKRVRRTGVASGTSSNWKRYHGSVMIDIDTRGNNLGKKAEYFTTLITPHRHRPITGVTSHYHIHKNGLRIYLRYLDGSPLTVAHCKESNWQIGWVGVSRQASDFKHGVSKNFKSYGKNIYVDTQDPLGGFHNKKHTIFTSISGTSNHWTTRGASSVYAGPKGGFRNYIYGRSLSEARRYKYGLQWLSIADNSNEFYTGKTNSWKQGESGQITVHVSLKHLRLTKTPVVITSIHGTSSHWTSTGATSVVHPTKEGFKVTVSGVSLTNAKRYGYQLQWAILKNGGSVAESKRSVEVAKGFASNWKQYGSSGLYIDIKPKWKRKPSSVPSYFTTLVTPRQHKPLTGITSTYSNRRNSFRVYLRYTNGARLTVAHARRHGWKMAFVGVDQNGVNFKHGLNKAGWTKYGSNHAYIDTRDPFGGFEHNEKSHNIFTSMSGNSHHWTMRGPSSVYPGKAGHFRNYIYGGHVNYAKRYHYGINWLAIADASKTFSTGRARNWKKSGSSEIMVHVNLRHLNLKKTPVVITSIHGTSSHWTSTGATSILHASRHGFTVRVQNVNINMARSYKYELQWAIPKDQ